MPLTNGCKRVETSGWRYSVAQWVLKRLYGPREQYYFYPWPQAGISANVIFTHKKKVMLQLRGNANEADNCWGMFGGYSDTRSEAPYEALHREIIEECSLVLPKNAFRDDNPVATISTFGRPTVALEGENHTSTFWHYELTKKEIEQMKPLDETAGFELFSWHEVRQLWQDHKIDQVQTPDVYRACEIAKQKGLID